MGRKFVSSFLVILLLLVLHSSALAATYYVSNNGDDAKDGLSEANAWKTISKVNSSSFSPGDSILFERGGHWREKLTIPSAGSSGNPITFGAYGSGNRPIIDGSDVEDYGWVQYSGNIYYQSLGRDAWRIWHDGIELDYVAGGYATLRPGEFARVGATCYLNVGTNPNGKNIEIPMRDECIKLEQDYIKFENLHLVKSQQTALLCYYTSADYITLENCKFEHAVRNGLAANNGSYAKTNWIIRNCIFIDNGINPMFHHIYFNTTDNSLVEECYFDNDYSHGDGGKGFAVQFQNGSDNNIIRYNFIKGGRGAFANAGTASNNNEWYYNVVAKVERMVFYISSGSGVKVYGNSCYGFYYYAIELTGTTLADVRNNIFWGANDRIRIYHLSNSANITTSDYNILGPENGSFVYWNGNNYTSLSNYQSGTGKDSNSTNENPLYTDPANDDLTLQSGSPAIDAGTNLGANYRDALNPNSSWPSSVSTLNQDGNPPWEIGAFKHGTSSDPDPPDPPTGLTIL